MVFARSFIKVNEAWISITSLFTKLAAFGIRKTLDLKGKKLSWQHWACGVRLFLALVSCKSFCVASALPFFIYVHIFLHIYTYKYFFRLCPFFYNLLCITEHLHSPTQSALAYAHTHICTCIYRQQSAAFYSLLNSNAFRSFVSYNFRIRHVLSMYLWVHSTCELYLRIFKHHFRGFSSSFCMHICMYMYIWVCVIATFSCEHCSPFSLTLYCWIANHTLSPSFSSTCFATRAHCASTNLLYFWLLLRFCFLFSCTIVCKSFCDLHVCVCVCCFELPLA